MKNNLLFITCVCITMQLQANDPQPTHELVSLPIQYDSVITLSSAYIPLQSDQTRTLLIGKVQKKGIPDKSIQRNHINDYAHTFLKQHRPESTESTKSGVSRSIDDESITFLNALAKNIETDMEKNKIKDITASYLDSILLIALRSYYVYINLAPSFIKDVDVFIRAYFQDHDMPINAIPTEMKAEFASRRMNLLLSIQAILDRRKKEDMPDNEIATMINKTFEAFIERAQHIYTWHWVQDQINTDKNASTDTKTSSLHTVKESAVTEKNKTFVPFLKHKLN